MNQQRFYITAWHNDKLLLSNSPAIATKSVHESLQFTALI
jgi:hypothetical protein